MDKKKSKGLSNFDKLAKNISKEERKNILSKYNDNFTIDINNVEEAAKKSGKKESPKVFLLQNYREEGILTKLAVWLKSIFFNKNIEDVYNASIINRLGKSLEHDFPGIISFKKKQLCEVFYSKLSELKNAQMFLKKIIYNCEIQSNIFFISLASVVMPEINEEIKTSSNPFQYPFTSELSVDTKTMLINRMDEILTQIPNDKKEKMFVCAQTYEWLKLFCKLPLENMLSKFSVVEGEKKTLFVQIKSEYNNFARFLTSTLNIQPELLATIDFLQKPQVYGAQEVSSDPTQFTKKFDAEISVINMFINTVPTVKIGKVLFSNSLYQPEPLGGNENWFGKYRDQCYDYFEKTWKSWMKEYKKEGIKEKLKLYFSIQNFQQFPYHPWERVKDEFDFKYDLSLGFLNYYFKREYVKYESMLNVVTLEGDFEIKDNRKEFNDTLMMLHGCAEELELLEKKLSISGEFGQEFVRYVEGVRGTSDKEKIKIIMNEISTAAQNAIDTFDKSFDSFENLLVAMLGEKTSPYYGPLTNLSKIMGRSNKEFRENLVSFRYSIDNANEILKEMKAVEGN